METSYDEDAQHNMSINKVGDSIRNHGFQEQVSAQIVKEVDETLFMIQDELEYLPVTVQNYYAAQEHSKNNLLHFNVSVQGSDFRALLDCGASREFVDLAAAQKRGFRPIPLKQPFAVRLANSEVIICKHYIPAKLKLQKFDHKCDLYVLDLKGEHELILGQSFLQSRNPIIDWTTGEMELRKEHANGIVSTRSIQACNVSKQEIIDSTIDSADENSCSPEQMTPEYDLSSINIDTVTDEVREDIFNSMADQYTDAVVNQKTFRKMLKRQKKKDQFVNAVVWLRQNENGETVFALNAEGEEETSREKFVAEFMEKHSDVFVKDLPPGVSETRREVGELKIRDGDPEDPPASKVIRLNSSQLTELRTQLAFNLERGFIRPSSSAYATPVFFVAKPHTSPVKWRMCCDYRLLNSIMKKDANPLPAPDQIIDRLQGAKFFSKIDLTTFFHQIPIEKESIHKTAITTRYGNFEWLVVPFGLHNAPPTAVRFANRIFMDFLDKFVIIFMDDILIFSNTAEEHKEHLEQLFNRMREYKVYAHPDKCELLVQKLWYLGIGISPEGVFISDTTKEAIMNWEIPRPNQKNKKGNRRANPDGKTAIRTFLGMVSFFRKFIPRLSERAKPLYDLLHADASFSDWNYTHDMAFFDLRDALLSSDVLQIPDSRKPFVIYPDASKVGVGGVLMQDQGDGLKPCAYVSAKLTEAMLKRGAYETELWAMIKCLQTWKHYLHGTSVEIRTDHAPLKYYHTQGKLTDKVVRWLDFLSEFDFTVKHVPREQNMAADCFSKNPQFYENDDAIWKGHNETISEAAVLEQSEVIALLGQGPYAVKTNYFTAMRTFEVKTDKFKSSGDDFLNVLTRGARTEQLTKWLEVLKLSYQTDPFSKGIIANIKQHDNWHFVNDVLYKSDTHHGLRIYVPETCMISRKDGTVLSLRAQLLYEYHDAITAGHQGFRRSLLLISRYFWWPRLRHEMYMHVRSCKFCQKAKRRTRPLGKYVGQNPPERRWQDVSFDFITDMPLTKTGNNAIHVIMDQTSRRIRLDACNMHITSEQTARLVFNTLIRNHGVPRRIISDRDVRYTAQVWNTVWTILGTKLAMSAAYDPLTNAANERSHAVIEDMLRSYVTDVAEWDLYIPIVEYAINNSPNIDTGRTPFELDCGQHPLDPLTMSLEPSSAGILEDWNRAILDALEAYKLAQNRRLELINSRRWAPNFGVGDKVFMSTEFLVSPEGQKRGRKLRFRWAGPFEVEEMSRNQLSAKLKFTDIQTKIHNVIPVNRLKLAYSDEPYSKKARMHEKPPETEIFDDTHFYEVEKIEGRRIRRQNYQYLVKFLGYDYQSNEWLPERELRESCRELLDQYDAIHPK